MLINVRRIYILINWHGLKGLKTKTSPWRFGCWKSGDYRVNDGSPVEDLALLRENYQTILKYELYLFLKENNEDTMKSLE